MQFEVKVDASASWMEVMEEVNENKFILQIRPNASQLRLYIDGENENASNCVGLQSKRVVRVGGNWETISLSLISDDN